MRQKFLPLKEILEQYSLKEMMMEILKLLALFLPSFDVHIN